MKTMDLKTVSVGVSFFKMPKGKIQTDLLLSPKENQLSKTHTDLGGKII